MFRSRRQPWKLLVPTAAAAVLFTLVPLSGVAEAALPPAQDTSTFCQHVPASNPFTDVGPGVHQSNILCLSYAGITQGTTATTYSPNAVVTRGQMASFIARAIDMANTLETPGTSLTNLPADDGSSPFTDVDASNVHKGNITRLFNAGIVNGKTSDTYDPAGPVTRAQMASFINRAEDFLTGTPFSSTEDFFTDDETSVHEGNINGIAGAGIAQGVSGTLYDPDSGVTRQQMASFLIRWLSVEEAAGDITPLPGNPPDLVSASATDTDTNGALSTGDTIVLTFADSVDVASSITLTDADGSVVTLTDDSPVPSGATAATFVVSNGGTTLTITVTGTVVATGGNSKLDGPVVITDADGITDTETGEPWVPSNDDTADVSFTFPVSPGTTGTVTFVNAATDTYRFVPAGGSAEITVVYKAADKFKDDGVTATLAKFETDLSVGDTIRFTDDTSATNSDTHELTNVSPSSVNSGTVGNIDTVARTFVIIDPVTGVAVSDVKNYNASLYSVDGTTATQPTFEAAVNEGDTVVITVPTSGASTFALTNKTVSGTISAIDTGLPKTVMIGALGDDPTGPQDAAYNYVLATSTYTIGGVTKTQAEFEAQANAGDLLSYTRSGGTQTFALTNQAPAAQSGTVTETHDPVANTVTVVNGATRSVVSYTGTPVYKIDNVSATEAEFESALTEGDAVTFTPDDNSTAGDERQISLTNSTPAPFAKVTGSLKDIQVGADTYDVVNTAGGIIVDNLNYVTAPADFGAHPARYFVKSGAAAETEVTLAQYEQYLTKIAAATTPVADVNIFSTANAYEHHLTTDQTIP